MSNRIHGLEDIDCEKLRALRLSRGLTQETLAHSAGTTQATVCKIECGRRKRVRTLTKKALEAVLGADLSASRGGLSGRSQA